MDLQTGRFRQMKKSEAVVVIVAPYFPPSNLAGVHRPRFLAKHLADFGYKPIILTVKQHFYEEPNDPDLLQLIPDAVRVLRTEAYGSKRFRFIGDMSLRSFLPHLFELANLIKKEKVELIYFPLPPYYSSLLGVLFKVFKRIPFVIDYIDPWVTPFFPLWPKTKIGKLKLILSIILAHILEPIVLKTADGITGVGLEYFLPALKRNNVTNKPYVACPYGIEESDHEVCDTTFNKQDFFCKIGGNDKIVFTYAGALLPRAVETFLVLFQSIADLNKEDHAFAEEIRLLFIGTGTSSQNEQGYQVLPLARTQGIENLVKEIPHRQPYQSVLSILHSSSVVMVLGSDEIHYTPSKIFQALLSNRPVLAILQEKSTAIDFLKGIDRVELVTFSNFEDLNGKRDELLKAIRRAAHSSVKSYVGKRKMPDEFNEYTARSSVQKIAALFDKVRAKNM